MPPWMARTKLPLVQSDNRYGCITSTGRDARIFFVVDKKIRARKVPTVRALLCASA